MGLDGGYHIAVRPKFYTEQFERVCPYYMAFGMTYEQFWDGDNEMPKMFRKAFEIKQREQDRQAWLQGAYVYHAVGALTPALKALSKGKAQPYVERPFGEESKPLDVEKPVKKEVRDGEKAKTWFEMWAINFNDKFDKGEIKTKDGDENG